VIRKLLIFIFFLLVFLYPGRLFLNDNALAYPNKANRLNAIPSCSVNSSSGINDQSTITFSWFDAGGFDKNYKFLFWKTGDPSETTVSTSNCSNYSCSLKFSGLPQNTNYEWYVKTVDAGFCLWDCAAQANGPAVTSPTCPAENTIKKYSCDPNRFVCIESTNGEYTNVASCENNCNRPQADVYDCANRSDRCNAGDFPVCQDFPKSGGFDCRDPNCIMENDVNNTHSCAYQNACPTQGQPCSGPGTCCSGLSCTNGVCGLTSFDTSNPPNNPYADAPSPTPICEEASIAGGTCKVLSAIGSIPTTASGFISFMLGIILSLSGTVALILIIKSGYQLMTSQGNPEQLQAAREQLTAAIVGLLFIIFSLVFLEVIGVDILKIPGFE
jgi:hypothetical protein